MGLIYCKPWNPPYPTAPFWGVNGHLGWNNTAYKAANNSAIAASLTDLGLKTFRNGYSGSYNSTTGALTSSSAGTFLTFMNANPSIVVAPVLLPLYQTDWTLNPGTATESTAYTLGYNLGVDAATNLKGRVPWYEVGNEFDGYTITGGSGASKTQHDNAKFLICRGSILGMIAGIRSVDAVTPISWPGGTWVHYGFFACLMDGSTPSAPTTFDTTKIPVVQMKAWHWYVNGSTSNDNIQNVAGQGLPNTDMLACLQGLAPTGVPLIITEFGVNTINTSTGAALIPNSEFTSVGAGLTTASLQMDKWVAIRNSYSGMPIVSVMLYQLINSYNNATAPVDPNTYSVPTRYTVQNELGFGVLDQDGSTQMSQYSVVKAFVAANPV